MSWISAMAGLEGSGRFWVCSPMSRPTAGLSMALGTLDAWVGTFFIYLLAMFQTVLFGWILGPKRGMEELRRGAEIPVPGIVGWNLRYIAPVYLGVVFVAFLYQEIATKKGGMFRQVVEDPVVGASVGAIVLVIVLFLLIISQAVKRWERIEREQAEEAQ